MAIVTPVINFIQDQSLLLSKDVLKPTQCVSQTGKRSYVAAKVNKFSKKSKNGDQSQEHGKQQEPSEKNNFTQQNYKQSVKILQTKLKGGHERNLLHDKKRVKRPQSARTQMWNELDQLQCYEDQPPYVKLIQDISQVACDIDEGLVQKINQVSKQKIQRPMSAASRLRSSSATITPLESSDTNDINKNRQLSIDSIQRIYIESNKKRKIIDTPGPTHYNPNYSHRQSHVPTKSFNSTYAAAGRHYEFLFENKCDSSKIEGGQEENLGQSESKQCVEMERAEVTYVHGKREQKFPKAGSLHFKVSKRDCKYEASTHLGPQYYSPQMRLISLRTKAPVGQFTCQTKRPQSASANFQQNIHVGPGSYSTEERRKVYSGPKFNYKRNQRPPSAPPKVTSADHPGPGYYLGNIHRLSSYGLAKMGSEIKFPQSTRDGHMRSLRLVGSPKITLPVPLEDYKKEVDEFKQNDIAQQQKQRRPNPSKLGHWRRAPAWKMPTNYASKQRRHLPIEVIEVPQTISGLLLAIREIKKQIE